MALQYEIENQGIRVNGYDGGISYLQIPDELEDLPVLTVSQSAFAHREDIVYVKLPASLRRLERFAFYGCGSLEKVSLSDGIEDLYDGAFRHCVSLKETELDLSRNRYIVLRELLGDSDRTMCYHLRFPDGEARLTFPDYVTDYREDTRARAMHFHIEGAGFSYRECVSRTQIDFQGYDRTFGRIRFGDPELAGRIALDRLTLPYRLDPADRSEYESWIRENADAVIGPAVRERRADWLEYLVRNDLLAETAVQNGLRISAAQGTPELSSILMSGRSGRRRVNSGIRKMTL